MTETQILRDLDMALDVKALADDRAIFAIRLAIEGIGKDPWDTPARYEQIASAAARFHDHRFTMPMLTFWQGYEVISIWRVKPPSLSAQKCVSTVASVMATCCDANHFWWSARLLPIKSRTLLLDLLSWQQAHGISRGRSGEKQIHHEHLYGRMFYRPSGGPLMWASGPMRDPPMLDTISTAFGDPMPLPLPPSVYSYAGVENE